MQEVFGRIPLILALDAVDPFPILNVRFIIFNFMEEKQKQKQKLKEKKEAKLMHWQIYYILNSVAFKAKLLACPHTIAVELMLM